MPYDLANNPLCDKLGRQFFDHMSSLEFYEDILIPCLIEKGKITLALSIAGAIGANLVHYLSNRLAKKDQEHNESFNQDYIRRKCLEYHRIASRNAVGSSIGFAAKTGVLFFSSGAYLATNTTSRLACDASAKVMCDRHPELFGASQGSWSYTIAKATTSAFVGTMVYGAMESFQMPWTSRFVSAGASALSEQLYDGICSRLIKKRH